MKVSVSMGTYNQERFIAQAIESVMMQETNFDYELVIGEDCSTDRTGDICAAYREKYPDMIRLLRREKNLGAMQNFVKTFYSCKGEYIATIAGDDYWTSPHKLQRQVDFLETHPHYTMCFTQTMWFFEDNDREPYYVPPPGYKNYTLTLEDLIRGNPISASSVMYRNGLFDRFPEWFFSIKLEDLALHILNAQHGKVGYIPEAMAAYRIHANSIYASRSLLERLVMHVDFFEALNAHLNAKYQPLIRERLTELYQGIAGESLLTGANADARRYALKSIKSLPLRKYFSKKAFMKSSLGIFAISIMPRWAMKAEEAVGKLLNSILGAVGLKLTRKKNVENVPQQPSRHTLRGTLEHAKRLGLEPKTVIDVGAGTGTFELYETFTNSTHILIDPLEENKPYMEKIVERLKNADYLIAAAASKPGTVTINVHKDFYGSSLYKESEGPDVDGIQRTVPAITLDEMCKERGLQGPYLIKVDVQGAELDVLSGASQVLKDTEYVVLEICLMGFLIGGPQLYDVVKFMNERGFVVYDILDYGYRPLDGAMSQVDMAFVKESGQFRKDRSFATEEQREKFYAKLLKDRNRTA